MEKAGNNVSRIDGFSSFVFGISELCLRIDAFSAFSQKKKRDEWSGVQGLGEWNQNQNLTSWPDATAIRELFSGNHASNMEVYGLMPGR